jgi:hypothetical protein
MADADGDGRRRHRDDIDRDRGSRAVARRAGDGGRSIPDLAAARRARHGVDGRRQRGLLRADAPVGRPGGCRPVLASAPERAGRRAGCRRSRRARSPARPHADRADRGGAAGAAAAGVLGGRRGQVVRSADRCRRLADRAASACRPVRAVAQLDPLRRRHGRRELAVPPPGTARCRPAADAGDRAGMEAPAAARVRRGLGGGSGDVADRSSGVRPAGSDLVAAEAGRGHGRRGAPGPVVHGIDDLRGRGMGAGRLRGRRDRAPAI